MPYINMEVRRSRTFVPAEAHGIAGRWRGLAAETRSKAESLGTLGSTLDATWEGTAKERLMAEYDVLPGNVAGCAELLESLATQVESIAVTEWETVMERVWRPWDVGV